MGRKVLSIAAVAALALTVAEASAQGWPGEKQMFFIVPFAAGGGTDAFARPLAAQLEKQLKARILIENRAGAGGTAGAAAASKATPDGYTFFVGATHHAIAPAIYPKLSYDIEKDFAPIAMISRPPHVVVVNTKVAATSIKELVAAALADPGKMNYGSAGNGTTHHLAGELFKMLTKTQIAHVPYRGAGPALQDLIAGHITMNFDGLGSSAAAIQAGQIKALAVAAPARVKAFPDLPTAKEQGLDGYDVATWYALWAPKGTPDDIVKRMTAEVGTALKEPGIIAAWERQGSDVPDLRGEAFGKFVSSEVTRWGKVVKEAGVKLEGN